MGPVNHLPSDTDAEGANRTSRDYSEGPVWHSESKRWLVEVRYPDLTRKRRRFRRPYGVRLISSISRPPASKMNEKSLAGSLRKAAAAAAKPAGGPLGFEPKGRIFAAGHFCASLAECGRNTNSAAGENMRKISASARIDSALPPCRSQGIGKERDAAQEARNRPHFEQFGSRFFRPLFLRS